MEWPLLGLGVRALAALSGRGSQVRTKPIGRERALRLFHLPAMSPSSRRPNCCELARITEPRVTREANMATLVPSRSALRIALLVGGGKSGALTDADFQGCRWIEGEPKPLRRGMFCGRPVLVGESWCAIHRGIVFDEERWR